MYKHILVITNKDNVFTPALEQANDIANRFGAIVDVISFVDDHQNDDDISNRNQLLSEHLNSCFDGHIEVTPQIIVTTNLVHWTKAYCSNNPVDLVIKTGKRSESLFYTPTDWQLIRELPCSLLIASDRKWRANSTILAAVDAGDDSQQQRMDHQVLREAYHWAQLQDYQLHAVYTVPMPKAAIELDMLETEQFERNNGELARQKLHHLLDNSGLQGIEANINFGSPEKRVPSLANKIKADLVVVGSVGRKGINGLLLGNTAEKVLHQLRTDILVVKPQPILP